MAKSHSTITKLKNEEAIESDKIPQVTVGTAELMIENTSKESKMEKNERKKSNAPASPGITLSSHLSEAPEKTEEGLLHSLTESSSITSLKSPEINSDDKTVFPKNLSGAIFGGTGDLKKEKNPAEVLSPQSVLIADDDYLVEEGYQSAKMDTYTLSYYKEDMSIVPMPERTVRRRTGMDTYKSVESINNIFVVAKVGIIKASSLLFVMCWAIALFYGGLAILSNDWMRSVVNYQRDRISGTSYTLVGLFGLTRLDVAQLSDGAVVTMYRDCLDYKKLEDSITCGAAENAFGSHSKEVLEGNSDVRPGSSRHAKEDRGEDTLPARQAVMSLRYPSCHVENEFIERAGCFRPICAVGDLSADDRNYFVGLYGPTVYDIHCSEISNLRSGGLILYSMAVLSLVLLSIVIILSSERYLKRKLNSSIRILLRNINHVIWTLSILFSGIAFIIWNYKAGGSACIDVNGKPMPCSFHNATYFFIIYMSTNIVGFIFYIINCVAKP